MLKASLAVGLLFVTFVAAEASFERALRNGPYRDEGNLKYWESNPNALKAEQASGLVFAPSPSSSTSSEITRLRHEVSKADVDSYNTPDSTLHDMRVYHGKGVRYEGSFDRESEASSEGFKTGVDSADDYVHGESRKKKHKVNVEYYKKPRHGGRRRRDYSDSTSRSESTDSEKTKDSRDRRHKNRRRRSKALF